MIVAGGTYIEECASPRFIALLGSGGRAALALSELETIEYHTFYPDADEITANFGARAVTYPSYASVRFHYLHPLSRPQITPTSFVRLPPIRIAGDRVLRFGCLEGDFIVEARQAIYDPQGSDVMFRANGSVADQLVIVLNENEARRLASEHNVLEAGSGILSSENAEAVVIKRGAAGALIFSNEAEPRAVPAFRTNTVQKIGSGDIFSSMLAYYWSSEGRPIEEAVMLASRQTADYVQTRIVQRPAEPPMFDPASGNPERLSILLVADEDTTCALWLVDEARTALQELGVGNVRVADPHLGLSDDDWLSGCDAVLALPQTGNGFAASIAYAAKDRRVPCIAFTEAMSTEAAFTRADAVVVGDFPASIYSAIWTDR